MVNGERMDMEILGVVMKMGDDVRIFESLFLYRLR
jgi:hypothetical protein